MKPLKMSVTLILAALVAASTFATPAFAAKPFTTKTFQVRTSAATPLTAPPVVTPEQAAQNEAILQQLSEFRQQRILAIPRGAGAPPAMFSPPTSIGPSALMRSSGEHAAPGDFTLFRSTVLTDAMTNNNTSSTNEPSVSANCENVFYTGNGYAALSSDGGQNFTYVEPRTTFPAYSAGFCCDQVVYYEESRGIFFWYLQYSRDGNGNNSSVLAWSVDNGANWSHVMFSPQADFGFGNGVWLDFPEVSVSNNYVYFTTDIVGPDPEDAIALKAHLDDVTDGGGVTFMGFFSEEPFLRPTHGATSTMYIGEHQSTSELRIYSWAEGDAIPASFVDRAVDTWLTGTYTAPSPDGTDYVNYGIPPLLAAWVADGKVGFMWDSVQGDGFPWPNIRVAVFNQAGLGLSSQGQIWNNEYAWAYPSVHPNDDGNLGGTMVYGGGNPPNTNPAPYPSVAAWIADDYNGDVIAPVEAYTIATSDAGPTNNRWGDYLTSRQALPYGNTWAATGFVLNGGQTGASVDPYYIWFGREQDTPGPTIACPGDVTVECTGTCGTPANDAQLAAFFAGVSASDLCGYTISDNAPACFGFGTTTVTFTVVSDVGLSASCTADVTVEDTTDPVVMCPSNITIECSDHCEGGGVPKDDPQLTAFFAAFSATDVCDDNLDIVDDAPDCFPLGTTTVTWTATDDSGNHASCSADVTVEDTTPPEIAVSLNRYALWPPNHKYADITATVEVEDVCDPDPEWWLAWVMSDEPDNGHSDGNTTMDIDMVDIGTPDTSFRLRSERQGTGDGRKYTIIYCAEDESGNQACDTACVFVPHDKGHPAMASNGYAAGGESFEPGATTFSILIPSTEDVTAVEIDRTRAQIGNTAGVVSPAETRILDVNDDGVDDMILTYYVDEVEALPLKEWNGDEDGKGKSAGVGNHALVFFGHDGRIWQVGDIYALGDPVLFDKDDGGPIWNKEDLPLDVASRTLENGIVSIYPNPFNPSTTIRYDVATPGNVKIAIYNVKGSLVRLLVNRHMGAGTYDAPWDGTDSSGRTVATGVYFARLVIGDFDMTRKMVLLK